MQHEAVIDNETLGIVGVEVSENGALLHRLVLPPAQPRDGQWIDTDLSGLPQEVRDICTAAWTPAARAAYIAHYEATVGQLVSDLQARRESAVMGRFEFALAAAQAGYISYEEAAAWAAGNAMPPAVQAVLDTLPAQEKGPALVDVLARPQIRRSGGLMPAIAAAFGTDDAGLDALFGL